MDEVLVWVIAATAAILGLAVGSFLNVVIHRVPAGQSIWRPPSHCPHCEARIKWYDNIPVVSWLVLRGKCRNCGAPISPRYLVVELVTAVAFGLVAWIFTPVSPVILAQPGIPAGQAVVAAVLVLLAYLWFVAAGIALAAIDFEVQRLPNPIVYSSFIAILVLFGAAAALRLQWLPLVTALSCAAGLFLFFLIVLFIAPRGGMGLGDVKLAAVVGLATGWIDWSATVVGAIAGFLLGSLVGIGLMIGRRAGRKTAIPFGPWMLIGAWAGILLGPLLWTWYAASLGLTEGA